MDAAHKKQKIALILSGGGARGAYQVGVLKGLAEIWPKKAESPFQILSGVSAGAINTSKLASDIEHFSNAVEKLVYLWSNLTSDQVFKTDLISLNKFSLSLLGKAKINSLLDTSPLKNLIQKNCDFDRIQKNIQSKNIETVIITANNYNKASAVSFVSSSTSVNNWTESRRHSEHTLLNADHIMASSAIPTLFPPVAIGNDFYGDGCVRNTTPCSPAIRMGAEKLFVIGVRTQLGLEKTFNLNESHPSSTPSIIKVINTLLNAVLLDAVEQDVMRIQRINKMAQFIPESQRLESGFKVIPSLCISPSVDIGEMARQQAHHIPRLIRMTLSAFGSLDEASEILSYLLFEAQFCKKLIEIGYHDALSSKDQIIDFFKEELA